MCEQCLPDTEFKLVHQINNHHLGEIESIPRQLKPLAKGILSHARSGHGLTVGEAWLTRVGTDDVALSRPLTRAPATAWPTQYTKSRAACTFSRRYWRIPFVALNFESGSCPIRSRCVFGVRQRGHGQSPLSRIVARRTLDYIRNRPFWEY